MVVKKRTIIEWPDSKDSENIAGYFRELKYVPEKTNDILKYFETLKPKDSLPNDSGIKLERALNKK